MCLSRVQRGRRFGDVIESVPYENSCLRELVSRAGVDFLQNESLAFMMWEKGSRDTQTGAERANARPLQHAERDPRQSRAIR